MKLENELSQRLSLLDKNQNDSIPKQLSPVQPEKLVKVDLTLPDMCPPSANTRALLYTRISAHGEGRRAYLARRKNLRPDEKYNFPMMTSSNYGWKVLDNSDLKKSHQARTGIIRDSFYRPSGVMFTAGVQDRVALSQIIISALILYKIFILIDLIKSINKKQCSEQFTYSTSCN